MSKSSRDVTTVLEGELADVVRQIEDAQAAGRRVAAGLSERQLTWRPDADRWSIAECLGHLIATADRYLPVLDRAIEEARGVGAVARGPFRHGVVGNWLVRMMEPPARLHLRSPGAFQPPSVGPARSALPGFLATQEALLERVRAAEGLDLARVKVVSPVTRLLKLSLGQSFIFLAAHQRRHLWQAQRVRDTAGFPPS